MVEFVWVLVGALAMNSGDVEPIPVLQQSAFPTKALCEQRLMRMEEDGYEVSVALNGEFVASIHRTLVIESYRCLGLVKPQ